MVASKVLLEAQEIKRRLLSKGEHAEEEVICELLESLDSNFEGDKIEHIVNMIIGNHDIEPETQNENENQAGPSYIETICLTPNTPSCSMDYKTCDDTNHLSSSSESDDDRDFYYSYNSVDSVEIIDEDVSSSSVLPICASSPTLPITSPSNPPVSSQDKATNNNKAAIVNNNNLNEIEIEENNNDVVCVTSAHEIKRETESPKPGCSKDLIDISSKIDEFCNTCNSEDLQKDAKQLHSILPSYDYSLIYETLLKNQNAINRIELTLWDLLPEKRPVAKILCKEKSSDKLVSSYNDEAKVAADTVMAITKNATMMAEDFVFSDTKFREMHNKLRENYNISKRSLQEPDTTKTTQKKIKCTNNAVAPSKTSNILRPAKLTFDNVANITFPVSSLISPPLEKQQQPAISAVNSTIPTIIPPPIVIPPSPLYVLPSATNMLLTPAAMASAKLRPRSFLLPPYSDPKLTSFLEGKSNNVLSPPKLHLLKQPENVTSTSASTSKAFVMNKDGKSSSLYLKDKKIPHLVNKQSAAATASNKTLCETETKEAKLTENTQLPGNESSENEILNLTKTNAKIQISPVNLSEPSKPKDMPILNASHLFNSNNEAKREEGNVDVSQDLNTKEVVHHEQANQKKMENAANTSNAKETVLTQRAYRIYYKLIPMFPTVHTEYIKQLCQQHVKEDLRDDTSILQQLAEYLLEFGKMHPNVKKVEPVAAASNTYDLNEHYADLLGIFPEADPGYLREKAEQIYKNPEKIKEFVQTQLENPTYPTRQQSLTQKRITDQVKQYTTDFQVVRFLEIFPDPFSYFEYDKRQCKFSPHGVDFLKNHFSKIRVHTMLNIYTQNKYNLSLTAKTLEHLSPDMKTKRYTTNRHMLTQDIPLLQECAFIQHKEELRMYLAQLKEKEEKEFSELKERNALLECQCCFDNECMPSKCSTCEEGHIFCNTCIIRGTELVLADGKTHVNCLMNCGSEFPLAVLQRVLQPTKFSILLCKRQEAEVMAAGLEGLVSCPFCHFASIPPAEDKVFKCLNPDCMKESCRLCKEPSHIPLKCEEVKNTDAARLFLEEKMTEALIRKCWKCGRTFFKEDGCNKMSCVCGAQMCYICDKPVINYRHFAGQGGDGGENLCPLWSDDRRLNAESVIKVCNETLKHIKEKNPKVDINVAALLPKLPPKRRGPHEEIVRADVLPEHANRIMRHIP